MSIPRPRVFRSPCHAVVAIALSTLGCQKLSEPLDPLTLDESAFRCEVEPVLMARCSTPVCHGSGTRPFRVFAVNRLRLNPQRADSGYVLNQPMTEEEHRANIEMALGFVRSDEHGRSLLLAKPLDSDAGGLYHQGKTMYGNADVFTDEEDPGYRAIEAWLAGGTRPADCVPREEVGS